jgi:alpha-L-rhamnosidase
MKKICFLISAFFIYASTMAQVKVSNLLCENKINPVGITVIQPRLSWQLTSDKRNTTQTAYEIKVRSDAATSNKGKVIWNSGKVNSSQSVHVPYSGSSLQQGVKYKWQVRVWDNSGKASDWSPLAHWYVGLLSPSDWKAKWIEPGYQEDTVSRAAAMFRKQFTANKKIRSAVAYITSHGLYEAAINGKRVGDLYLTPGWTSYNKRLQYQMYDVTNLLVQGKNAIGATLGDGWYRGTFGFYGGRRNIYGKYLGLLLQLNIHYEDGTSETVLSDESWKSSTGSILYSEIYAGEIQDARKEQAGWTTANFDDSRWSGVQTKNYSNENIVPTENEPVKKQEVFKPVKVFTTPNGDKVIDFGQNLVGWVVMKAKGNAGDKITLSHAEVLDKKGNFYTENLRRAKQKNIYTLKGGDEETFEPHFTWQGFRYLKVEGVSGDLKPENFRAVALYSDMKPTGNFSCSNPLVNQLQHNIQWSQKGNFIDIPTDCPQRDERLGWTGDAQVFSSTSAFNMNVNSFFAKWMKDVAADQHPDGGVTNVVPNIVGNEGRIAGWADVATIIPWDMYRVYGDKKILEEQYPSMKAWVQYIQKKSPNHLWNTGGFSFGDWLSYRPDDDLHGRAAITNKHLISQCFYAHSVQLLINTAGVLGKHEDVKTYSSLIKDIKSAFLQEYVTPNGILVSETQTAYALVLNFDMLPESMRPGMAKRLANNIASYNNHLTTGFLGTPYLSHVLTRFGYNDVAYKLMLQETFPSWLYPVKMGATTIWERWDGQKSDSTFQNPFMNSFNHYAYGAVGDWMYRVMAGLSEDAPGYKKIKIMPHIGEGITSAKAELQTYYGKASSAWQLQNKQLVLSVEVPANTSASIFIPAKHVEAITEGGKRLSGISELKIIGKEGEYINVEAGSGKYVFKVN